jgi:hypothetical protein
MAAGERGWCSWGYQTLEHCRVAWQRPPRGASEGGEAVDVRVRALWVNFGLYCESGCWGELGTAAAAAAAAAADAAADAAAVGQIKP